MRVISCLITALLLAVCVASYGQSGKITVNGTVVDKTTRDPAIGVTVLVGSPPKAVAITDSKGAFSVVVDAGSTLTFRYIGFEQEHQKVTKSTNNLKIYLSPSSSALKEAVIVGFKSQTRETATGAVTTISGKQLQDVPVANVAELLQGKVAGLNVQNNNGAPGSMGTIQLRGLSTAQVSSTGFLTPTSPLFVVDGVPVDANAGYSYGFNQAGPGISPLSLIPPEDIASVQVLKDAAATAVYGSRGAYGVIIITTKRGKSKIPIVSYSANVFFNTPPKLRNVIGGKEERELRIWEIMNFDSTYNAAKALVNSTSFLSDSLNPYYNNSTNWQSLLFRTTYNQTHNLSISGGDDIFNYKTNLNYYQEDGIIKNTGFERYTLSMNALYQPNSTFRMLTSMQTSYGKKNNGSGVGLLQSGVSQGVNSSSLLPPPSMYSDNNAVLGTMSVKDNNKTAEIMASLDIQYEPITGIRFGDVFSYDYTSATSDRFSPSFLNNGSSDSYSYGSQNYTLYNRATVTFTKTINTRHLLSAYIFDELTSTRLRAHDIDIIQTPNNEIQGPIGYNWFNSAGGTLNNLIDQKIHGFGGSVSYNYDTKYILNFSYRLDGTSTNGPSKGYSLDPAISARWNFNREHWFDDVPWLSYGSLRASWGRNIVPTGTVFDVYGTYGPGSNYNDQQTINIDYKYLPNNNFQPQTTTTTDVGFEGGFFQDRLELTLDAYYKSVDNEVIDQDLPNMAGFTKQKVNAISLVDYGTEWTVTYRIFKPSENEKALQSTISINGAFNRDVLTRLPGGLRQMEIMVKDLNDVEVPVLYRLGRNTLSNELYFTDGVYANDKTVPTDPMTGLPQQVINGTSSVYLHGGSPHWADINGDYKIDDNDFVTVGNPEPKVVGGINSYTTWNNFSLNINVSYTLYRDLLNTNVASLFQHFGNPVNTYPVIPPLLPIGDFNYWKPATGGKPGDGTPGAVYANPFDFTQYNIVQPFRYNQTVFMEDGSYWKINNITLGYNIPRKSTERWHITSTRIYVTANNVYTFSKYTGPDPENVTALGRDQSGGYPSRRSYSFGINVQF